MDSVNAPDQKRARTSVEINNYCSRLLHLDVSWQALHPGRTYLSQNLHSNYVTPESNWNSLL
jgi:hypothetical protein